MYFKATYEAIQHPSNASRLAVFCFVAKFGYPQTELEQCEF
jgi:hypothetical protein